SVRDQSLTQLLDLHGFDRAQHEQIRSELKEGRIGLAQNRLPASALIQDVNPDDVVELSALRSRTSELESVGRASLQKGEVAVITLAAGAGSRWTQEIGRAHV